MSVRQQSPQRPPSEAAQWFARMHDDARTPQVEAEFHRWLTQDPANERAYQRLEALWSSVGQTRDAPAIKVARVEAVAESERMAQRLASVSWRRGSGLLAAAAAVAAVAFVAITAPTLVHENAYETTVGDRRTIQLTDGSELTLNTNSRAIVRYGWRSRNVILERGQARFKVAHSALRPFFVNAGRGLIRSIGTEFDVYRQADRVHVTLLEGRIKLTSLQPSRQSELVGATAALDEFNDSGTAVPAQTVEMTAGQKASLSSSGIAPVQQVNVAQATAWLDGKLVFDNVRLQDAVDDVNRYSTRKIYVLDAGLSDLRVNGVFRTDRADAFIEAVRRSLPVTIQPASDGALVIAPR